MSFGGLGSVHETPPGDNNDWSSFGESFGLKANCRMILMMILSCSGTNSHNLFEGLCRHGQLVAALRSVGVSG